MHMTVARIFDGKGWTTEQYDELLRRLLDVLGRGRRTAPGVLFHWSAPTGDGMRAVDVYESRDAADRLVAETIGPIAGPECGEVAALASHRIDDPEHLSPSDPDGGAVARGNGY